MKSLHIVFADKQIVELREEELAPLKPEEIRCAAKKSLVSTGTELSCLRGVFDPQTNWEGWVKYPFYPGYCMSAEVIEVGEAVQGIHVGDSISANVSHRQFFNLNFRQAYVTPAGVGHEQACWTAIAKITQVGVRRAELKLGESVGVIGLGLLGQMVVQYLRAFGARRIIAIDPAAFRLEKARQSGATHLLSSDALSAQEEIKRITDGIMLDAVYDVTGHPAVLGAATQLVREMGRVVLLGDTPTPSQQMIGPRVVSNSIAILGIHARMARNYNGVTADEMTALFNDYLIRGQMDVSHLISHRFSPLEATSVYDWLVRDRTSALGVLFDWERL